MTVSTTVSVFRYAGNGVTTSFSYPSRFNAQADLDVSLYDTTLETTDSQVLTTDYTITGTVTNGKYLSGGNIIFVVAPPTGQTVVLDRELALTQSSDYQIADSFEPDTLESDLDRLILIDQQQQAEIGRAIKLGVASTLSDLELPDPEANQVIGWNSAADGLENKSAVDLDMTTVSAFMATLLDDSTAALARATLELNKEYISFAISDETTALTTGTNKIKYEVQRAFTLTAVHASLSTASSSGLPTFDVNKNGTTMLSTKLTIDANEVTSRTSATAAVISVSSLAVGDEIEVDIDVAGTGAKGAKIYLEGTIT